MHPLGTDKQNVSSLASKHKEFCQYPLLMDPSSSAITWCALLHRTCHRMTAKAIRPDHSHSEPIIIFIRDVNQSPVQMRIANARGRVDTDLSCMCHDLRCEYTYSETDCMQGMIIFHVKVSIFRGTVISWLWGAVAIALDSEKPFLVLLVDEVKLAMFTLQLWTRELPRINYSGPCQGQQRACLLVVEHPLKHHCEQPTRIIYNTSSNATVPKKNYSPGPATTPSGRRTANNVHSTDFLR